ncbi:uncharacterized protein LOC110100125 [Dendrobium catenatum]|uniref:uncharacterized protein LOC110100125 n=1 Tax=Dendrobium catenatum TaxID=906689 RepID=UPI00109FFA8D|nr:uncharacterized protein LOC110100125 [Dendrobium catenatum]
MVTGKGKEVVKEDEFLSLKKFKTATGFKEMMENLKGESSTSAGKINFKTTSLPTSPISCNIVESSPDEIIKANENKVNEEFLMLADKQGKCDEGVNISKEDSNKKEINSVWSKKQNIRVDKLDLGSFLSDDGRTVQLDAENESINAKKLDCALVVKIFGDNILFSSVCIELRKQWSRFGKFHITGLGTGWVLCSFKNPETMEEVITGGPWYVKGHVVGLDKWSPMFSTNSLKGISTPLWIRLPNLSLQCWDDINICRIASKVGKPYLLDGNSFQWSRREYARVCVRVPLNEKLPLGVWVEGLYGKFFQKIIYEGISKLCYECAFIGHTITACMKFKEKKTSSTDVPVLDKKFQDQVSSRIEESSIQQEGENKYGLWIQAKYGKKKFSGNIRRMSGTPIKQRLQNDVLKNPQNNFTPVEEVCVHHVEALDSANIVEDQTKKAQIQEQKMGAEVLKLEKIVEKSSSGKKVKLLKELKSLGSGNIVNHNMKLEIGRIETKVSSLENLQILNFLGDKCESFLFPSVVLSGGILVLWRKDVAAFSVLEVSSQVIIGDLEVVNKGCWQVSIVCGSWSIVERKSLWEILETRFDNNKPAVIGGNFNYILSQEEKRGGKKFVFTQGAKDMKMFMNNNDFHEIGFIGPKFTWCNNKTGGGRILERLDRCLINIFAMNSIHLALVKHLSRIALDHCPIFLEVFKSVVSNYKCIHFEDVWSTYHGAFAIVKNTWKMGGGSDPASSLNLKFKRTLKALFYWSTAKFKSLNVLRDSLKKEIYDLQLEEADGMLSETKLLLLRSKVNELNSTLARLCIWWRQRAKARWLEEGDTDSAFFHSFANARRSTNWINQVKNEDGIFTDQIQEIEMIFSNFFTAKWRHRTCKVDGWPSKMKTVLDKEDQLKLEAEFLKEELQEVVNNLGKNISPGLDRITFSFIKCYWKIDEYLYNHQMDSATVMASFESYFNNSEAAMNADMLRIGRVACGLLDRFRFVEVSSSVMISLSVLLGR